MEQTEQTEQTQEGSMLELHEKLIDFQLKSLKDDILKNLRELYNLAAQGKIVQIPGEVEVKDLIIKLK